MQLREGLMQSGNWTHVRNETIPFISQLVPEGPTLDP
jgi:hypothetical protein